MEDDIARFVIDGREYPVPEVDSFTLDEACVVWDYSKLGLDQLSDNTNNPWVYRAYVHIAYARGNPDVDEATISELVKGSSLVSVMEKLGGETNPTTQTPDTTSSPPSSSSSDASSGEGSTNGSDEPADVPSSTGASRSATLHI